MKVNKWSGYLFLLPLYATLGFVFFYSMFFLVQMSFYKFDLSFANYEWRGFRHFELLFRDKYFFQALLNNLVFIATTIIIFITVGFIISFLLSFEIRGSRWFRGIFFVPSILAPALLATVFQLLLEYRFGFLNQGLRAIGLDALAFNWLSSPTGAYIWVMILNGYGLGLAILYYTVALTTVPQSVIESAKLDGARKRHMALLIIFPMLKHTHIFIAVTTILTYFRSFENVLLLTGGGPGNKTEITGSMIYKSATTSSNLGYVSAMSLAVVVVALIVAVTVVKFTNFINPNHDE